MPATSARCWPQVPTIVAEALLSVTDPLALWLRTGPISAPASTANAIARSAVTPPTAITAPAWLRPEQRAAFATLLPVIHRHHGALLADATGTGKTFVALAVAGAYPSGTVAAVVPATLTRQWATRAATMGVALEVISHEDVSRGRVPAPATRLAIIDESHRFRHPGTKRYRFLAPWLAGRDALFVTATPIVNDPVDLAHQLLLAVRHDALAPLGVPSLPALLAGGRGHPALGDLVVAREPPAGSLPGRCHQVIRWSGEQAAPAWSTTIESLQLSSIPGVAELIRSVLWTAAGSSLAALDGCITRYATLLEHAADARAAGRELGREDLRAFTGPLGGQLTMWELISPAGDVGDLDPEDRVRARVARDQLGQQMASPDPKLEALCALLADGRPTIVFTVSVDTVRYLRQRLPNAAWCTGGAAGIGHLHATRDSILGGFAPQGIGPSVLITTDIAAEGLDLQRAVRVVHFDLPWTPMRIRQREGRVARMGALRPEVDIVWFLPPDWLDRKEHRAFRLRTKARMPALAGLSERAPELWRWRHDLAREAEGRESAPAGSCAVAIGPRPELLISFELHAGGERVGSTLGIVNESGDWVDDPSAIAAAIDAARDATPGSVTPETWRGWLDRAVPHARRLVRHGNDRRWSSADLHPDVRVFLRRLSRDATDAARRRNSRELALIEAGTVFATRGHTAGELILIKEIATASKPVLLRTLATLQDDVRPHEPIVLKVAGMVLFVRESEGMVG
ncbi:MAG: DEAD/DEAH box helicase [Gemmatimonadales bacterium]